MKNRGTSCSNERPGTVNMKVMRMDVDIMYEVKMDHDFVKVSVVARTNNLELGTFFGWTYEGEKMELGIVCGWAYEGDTGIRYVSRLDI